MSFFIVTVLGGVCQMLTSKKSVIRTSCRMLCCDKALHGLLDAKPPISQPRYVASTQQQSNLDAHHPVYLPAICALIGDCSRVF